MKEVKGLRVTVFRPSYGDCSNDGLSSKYNELILVGDGVVGPLTVDLDNPPENVVMLVKRTIFRREHLHVTPLDSCHALMGGGKWYSFGGNFAFTSDGRFPCDYPLAIHDRREV